MPKPRRIVITGTHLTPALELIRQLRQDHEFTWDIHYIGRSFNSSITKQPSIESKIIPKVNINFYGFQSLKFDRRYFPNTLAGVPQTFNSFIQIFKLIKRLQPSLVVSFGGYISVPVIITAWLQGIPSTTHEQTQTLSLSTKINHLFSKSTALSFPVSQTSKKFVLTGNLLRHEIYSTNSKLFSRLKLPKKDIIFITAGNQGSHQLNLILEKLLPILTQKYIVIHQCGLSDFPKYKNKISKTYLPFSYIQNQDIGWILNRAKLIISRAGANTCQEIVALKKSSILIPLKVSQQNEQDLNANYVKINLPHKTTIISESKLTADSLLFAIQKLCKLKKTIPVKPKTNLNLLKLIKSI